MLALEEGKAAEYGKALDEAAGAILAEPQFLELLSSPAIGVSERLSAAEAVFSGRYPEHIVSFLMLLCEKGRMRHIAEINEDYTRLLREHERISDALVTSAEPLSEEEAKRLCEKLRVSLGHEVKIINKVDRSIIGGLVIEVDGKVLDGSVRGRLAEIKEVISK